MMITPPPLAPADTLLLPPCLPTTATLAQQVAAYVRTRTLDEVLLMVKEHQGASSTRMKAQEDWKGAAKKRADVTSEADLRCAAFTDVEVGPGCLLLIL